MRTETVARLLEQHGYLEMSPFGRTQSRRLVTAEAFATGHGHTVDPTGIRSIRLDGGGKAAPFPVFYEEYITSIVWSFGWDVIKAVVDAEPDKKRRLAFLLTQHSYLPDAEIADLAGYSRYRVMTARKRGSTAESNREKLAA